MRSKFVSQKEAVLIRLRLASEKKKVVFTNGCFDILHLGHALFLDKAKEMGDFLIVGVNNDKSVRRLKGAGRPIMSFKERAMLLSYLEPVDLVVGFGKDTPFELIQKLRPDVLVKGKDYRISEIVGAKQVKSWGGAVRRISLVRGKSTSNIVHKLSQKKTSKALKSR